MHPQWRVKTFYGELKNILVLHLPVTQQLDKDKPGELSLMLADVHACVDDIEGPLGTRAYQSMGTWQVYDMTCVQCLAGRVQLPRPGRPTWSIVDRTGALGGAIYTGDDDG